MRLRKPSLLLLALATGNLHCSGPSDTQLAWQDVRQTLSSGDSFFVSYTPNPDPIPPNDTFSLTVSVMDGSDQSSLLADAELSIDASMPEHEHAMNTLPVTTAHGDGTFVVQGMLFHMTGNWEIAGQVTVDGTTETATFATLCCELP